MKSHFIQLKDGRKLEFAEYGQHDGVPLMVFHGSPGSSIWVAGHIDKAEQAGIRLIVPARPGCGRSDPKPGYALLDWPNDVTELADSLSLQRFGVVGFSAGGPYVLACAAQMPDRLAAIGVASSPAPPTEETLASRPSRAELEAQYGPFAQQASNDPVGLAEGIIVSAPEEQRAAMEQYRAWWHDVFPDAFQQGPQAFFDEGEATFFVPWGFALDSIHERVYLWHGEEDLSVPVAHAHLIAESVPDCIATYLPGVGHLLPINVVDQIYRTLRSAIVSA